MQHAIDPHQTSHCLRHGIKIRIDLPDGNHMTGTYIVSSSHKDDPSPLDMLNNHIETIQRTLKTLSISLCTVDTISSSIMLNYIARVGNPCTQTTTWHSAAVCYTFQLFLDHVKSHEIAALRIIKHGIYDALHSHI